MQKAKVKIPYGFDITLIDLMAKYTFTEEIISKFKALHNDKRSGMAYAFIGQNAYYREHQIVDMLGLKVKEVSAEGEKKDGEIAESATLSAGTVVQ